MLTPDRNCPICPRLVAFREENRVKFPSYFNAPVPSFGGLDAGLLIIGLAPGLHGANQTGRPFTGDYAGFTLYEALQKYGFAEGDYLATLPPPLRGRAGEGGGAAHSFFSKDTPNGATPHPDPPPQGGREFRLLNCRITNAVRCVPQENKPEPSEIKHCNAFLEDEIAAMPNLKAILSLGLVSHNAVLRALGLKAGAAKFVHGAVHRIQDSGFRIQGKDSFLPESRIPNPESYLLFNSYHCSRYNINTGRLTQAMFDAVVEKISSSLRA